MATRELIAGFVTNAGTTMTTVTMSPGDSATVRYFPSDAKAHLDMVVLDLATAAREARIFSPNLHDQVNGIRLTAGAADSTAATGDYFLQELFQQDNLTIQATSGAADSSVVVLGIYYDRLPGTDARLATWSELAPRIQEYVGIRNDFNSSGTIGTWAGEALNADNDQLIANRDYAIVGADLSPNTSAVTWRGAESGNVRNGLPGGTNHLETRDYFVRRQTRLGIPFVPVFNSANKGNVTVETVDNAATTATSVNTIACLLTG